MQIASTQQSCIFPNELRDNSVRTLKLQCFLDSSTFYNVAMDINYGVAPKARVWQRWYVGDLFAEQIISYRDFCPLHPDHAFNRAAITSTLRKVRATLVQGFQEVWKICASFLAPPCVFWGWFSNTLWIWTGSTSSALLSSPRTTL